MSTTPTRVVELTEAEAHVLVKVTAAIYRGVVPPMLSRGERAALRRASVKAQAARESFPFRVAR